MKSQAGTAQWDEEINLSEPSALQDSTKKAETEARTGDEPVWEKALERFSGNAIHLFLSSLSLLALGAAGIATYHTIVVDFPRLWQEMNEYEALQRIIQSILLIAIAAELGLLLLFHRTTAAVEVIIFVIARKMLSPNIEVTGLAICTASIIGLIIGRFYYLPGNAK